MAAVMSPDRYSTLRELFRKCILKKNWTSNNISKRSKIRTSVLVSSAWIRHHYYARESRYQHSRLPQAPSSPVHEGLVLPLVGEQSQEHLVLPLIEAEEKARNAEKSFAKLTHGFNSSFFFIVAQHADLIR